MRTIKFRGKRLDNGEWVYGYYLYGTILDQHVIWTDNENWIVDPETVGQLTGNKDKFGKNDIYEDDIIEIEYYSGLPSTRDLDDLIVRAVCRYGTGCSFHLCGIGKSARMTYSINFGGSAVKRKEVIGNIHDNPELLEVTA